MLPFLTLPDKHCLRGWGQAKQITGHKQEPYSENVQDFRKEAAYLHWNSLENQIFLLLCHFNCPRCFCFKRGSTVITSCTNNSYTLIHTPQYMHTLC